MKKDATTNISNPWPEKDLVQALAADMTEAAERLGGEDGLKLIGISGGEGGKMSTTWRREWEEAPAAEGDAE